MKTYMMMVIPEKGSSKVLSPSASVRKYKSFPSSSSFPPSLNNPLLYVQNGSSSSNWEKISLLISNLKSSIVACEGTIRAPMTVLYHFEQRALILLLSASLGSIQAQIPRDFDITDCRSAMFQFSTVSEIFRQLIPSTLPLCK